MEQTIVRKISGSNTINLPPEVMRVLSLWGGDHVIIRVDDTKDYVTMSKHEVTA